MPAMTDVTEVCSTDDQCLSQQANTDGNPWLTQNCPSPLGPAPSQSMDTLPDSSAGYDEMPVLETLDSMQSVHYTSPVPSSFLEPDHLTPFTSKDVLDHNAEQGVTGLCNLGNTCFMNAGLQCLFGNPQIAHFFEEDFELDDTVRDTLTGKFCELLRKVWCGHYSAVHPGQFKTVLGMYHPQFKDFRQHDCQEFLALLLDSLHELLNQGRDSLMGAKCMEDEVQDTLMEPSISGVDGPDSEDNYDTPCHTSNISEEDSLVVKPETKVHGNSEDDVDQLSGNKMKCSSYLGDMDNVDESPGVISPQSVIENESGVSSTIISESNFISEDSNQSQAVSDDTCSSHSEVSQQSPNPFAGEDRLRRMASIPEFVRSTSVSSQSMDVCEHTVEEDPGGELHLHANEQGDCAELSRVQVCDVDSTSEYMKDSSVRYSDPADVSDNRLIANTRGKRLPSLEDLYMKDTKTLNTNVLATDYMSEDIATDSEKFHKPDNINRPTDPYENLGDFLTFSAKDATSKPVKETNLLANLKEKFPEDCFPPKSMISDVLAEDKDCSINNIKRMKIDEGEKNIRMQARLKVNMNKNPTKEENLHPSRPSEPDVALVLRPDGDHPLSPQPVPPVDVAAVVAAQFEEQMTVKNFLAAEEAWGRYLEKNQSVIVDTFQGQFKSTVVCSECRHVSVTYEPFMYLSVPLPHAMERQIEVVFMPCDTKQPIRYLLTMNKQDNVRKLKKQLHDMIGEESIDIAVAEVFDNHISRILEDNTLLKFINDYNRTVYAFEMLPLPQLDDLAPNDEEINPLMGDNVSESSETLPGCSNNITSTASCQANNLVSQAVGSGDMVAHPSISSSMEEVGNNLVNNAQRVSSSTDHKEWDATNILDNLGNHSSHREGLTSNSGMEWKDNLNSNLGHSPTSTTDPCDTSHVISGTLSWSSGTGNNDVLVSGSGLDDKKREVDLVSSKPEECSSSGGNDDTKCQTSANDVGETSGEMAFQWKSCAICLEEMIDGDLMVHAACGGTLCQSCLEMSFKHYGESAFICPVCSSSVNPADDFIQLSAMSDYKPKTRILSVPIVQRYEAYIGAEKQLCLFGHPNIMYLPSNVAGDALYECVDRAVPYLTAYSIHLVDGQGYHCSRCMYTEHCPGCVLPREGDISLQPGDHLAIHFSELSLDQVESAQNCSHHPSMVNLRPKDPLTLRDCFSAFTDSEILDEHNPWYCPRCKRNQCARKTITVWRYPEMLVVYLKRFVFHELSSTKIDNKVVFPLSNLDLTEFISGPVTSDLFYDLQSCVCHFGGVNAGHYTSYAKHPGNSEWNYFNDETATKMFPQEEDYSSVYILFYQRQGTHVDFVVPEKTAFPAENDQTLGPNASTNMELVPCQRGPISNDTISQLLQQLQEKPMGDEKEPEADSTLEFYS